MMNRMIGTVMFSVLLLTAGYALAAQQVVMDIRGMTCGVCPVAIKKSLEKVAEVKTVKVSFEDMKARLTVDDAVTDKTLEETVQKVGEQYKGKVVDKKPDR